MIADVPRHDRSRLPGDLVSHGSAFHYVTLWVAADPGDDEMLMCDAYTRNTTLLSAWIEKRRAR